MIETLILPTLGLIIGLVLLVWSSDIFIDGAASTSLHLKISPLIIGVVVLGFGTSLPEVIVSVLASVEGNPGLAIGNVIGSNIANIGLVLGITAIIAPIAIKSSLLKREFPVLLGVSLIGLILLLDKDLDVTDGFILLAMFFAVMIWMIKINKNIDPKDPLAEETLHEIEDLPKMSLNKALVLLGIGLAILIGSAKLMVWGAVEIAHFFEVPDMIIGLTIVAVGTSLPELAAAISAARKNEADLMIGNILGSNLFNLLAVMAMPALIAPSIIEANTLLIDYPIMLTLTLLMLLVALPRKGNAMITKLEGFLLLGSFIAYLVLIYFRMIA
ncbi:calcium/sodium antiporter [Thiosulfativibrio zosterae]|uniref:Sodium:calcium antiporter n=1 Tax=Thiosulfativibrio zosterae TaxID=2675053 RepID=A0A6F8PM77_9GAMM|nr:calcium/sodium antiporter [Thiosulfativibrio zosterae]BBP43211.1 sodium:calcium antiporter [Thiosulfativibrio zosterae]